MSKFETFICFVIVGLVFTLFLKFIDSLILKRAYVVPSIEQTIN